jgi:hypothetical protein
MRLNFSCLPIAQIEEGIQRLGLALTALLKKRKRAEEQHDMELAAQPIV